MQCPFLCEATTPACHTGANGVVLPTESDYERFCSSAKYYLCDTYRVAAGMKAKPRLKKTKVGHKA